MVYVIVRISVMEGNGNGDDKKVTISIFPSGASTLQVLQIMFS